MDVLSRTLPEKDARRLNDRQVFSNVVENVIADMVIKQAMERLRDISSGKLQESLEAATETSAESSPEVLLEAAPEDSTGIDDELAPQPLQPESLDTTYENDVPSTSTDKVSIEEN
jgi:hypothetical protein